MRRRYFLGMGVAHVLVRAPQTPLASPTDRRAFRSWFTWLAEMLYFLPPERRPREVSDCAALLRFAYREALRPHTSEWARSLGLEWLPPLAEIRRVPPDAGLFRTSDAATAHFADAGHLMRYNTHRITREVERAQAGDLLFYRQLSGDDPFHSMIYVGPSSFDSLREPRLVYHTGRDRGEILRPTLAELLAHPEPRWRPLQGNGNFLGVYRWNILRESD